MQTNTSVFVGLDTSKLKISVALAEEGRLGEVRFLGDIDSTPDSVRRLVEKLSRKYTKLSFCYSQSNPRSCAREAAMYQALRGVAFTTAVTFAKELRSAGDRASVGHPRMELCARQLLSRRPLAVIR
jgi:hypothetical protein